MLAGVPSVCSDVGASPWSEQPPARGCDGGVLSTTRQEMAAAGSSAPSRMTCRATGAQVWVNSTPSGQVLRSSGVLGQVHL